MANPKAIASSNPSARTKRILASAIASQRIEGLELDPQAKADFKSLEMGTISAKNLKSLLMQRYSKTTNAG